MSRSMKLLPMVLLAALGAGCDDDEIVCVAEGTQILTPGGSVLVETLHAGDVVVSIDPETRERHPASVLAVHRGAGECLRMVTDSGTHLLVTGAHPVYDPARGEYRKAFDWSNTEGIPVLEFDGDRCRVVGIEACAAETSRRAVFNLTVGPPFENFVANGIVVHNKPPVPRDQPYDLATTPGRLVQNLARSWNERDFEEYDLLLREEFTFYLALVGGKTRDFPHDWDRATEAAVAYNLFNSRPGEKPDGTPQAPVQRINMVLTEESPGAAWTDSVSEEFAGTLMKRYRVDMDVFYTEGNPTQIEGLQEFYAWPHEIEGDEGETVTVYELAFWRDLGKEELRAQAIELYTWSWLKALFREG